MEKYLALVGIIVVGAVAFPNFAMNQFNNSQSNAPQIQMPVVAEAELIKSEQVKPKRSHNPLEGRKIRIPMDQRGHFITKARMNGYSANVLVDTGATNVAINESTAQKLGIRLKASDFKYKVSTANGTVLVAAAIIDEVKIGRISVRNVTAGVLPDKSLKGTLLGMSFLRKLRKFEISDSELILVQ